MTGTSPPGPFRCGSTTCSVNAVAQAASNALPPRSRIPIPTAVAIQWVEVTTPKVPSISGRVVKRFGLTKFMGVPGVGQRPPELITVPHAGQRPWRPDRPAITPGRNRSGGLRGVRAARHAFEDSGPVFGVLDRLAHQLEKFLFLEIAPPALAAVKFHVMSAAAVGERVPFARRLDRSTKRSSIAHTARSPSAAIQRGAEGPTPRNKRNATTELERPTRVQPTGRP